MLYSPGNYRFAEAVADTRIFGAYVDVAEGTVTTYGDDSNAAITFVPDDHYRHEYGDWAKRMIVTIILDQLNLFSTTDDTARALVEHLGVCKFQIRKENETDKCTVTVLENQD